MKVLISIKTEAQHIELKRHCTYLGKGYYNTNTYFSFSYAKKHATEYVKLPFWIFKLLIYFNFNILTP